MSTSSDDFGRDLAPLADLPAPPYVAVIFSAQRTGLDAEGYATASHALWEIVQEQPGFLGIESVSDASGCELTISYWADAPSATAWCRHPEHLPLQRLGRERWYSAYRLRSGEITRHARFDGGEVTCSSPADFASLARSRRHWIDSELRTWCQRARRADLLLAEQEWVDIAGKADPVKTLWAWAWGRFPELVHADLGLDESHPVELLMRTGETQRGYPDARASERGQLVLHSLRSSGTPGGLGLFSIDDIQSVQRLAG